MIAEKYDFIGEENGDYFEFVCNGTKEGITKVVRLIPNPKPVHLLFSAVPIQYRRSA